jgi:hypothetical protein
MKEMYLVFTNWRREREPGGNADRPLSEGFIYLRRLISSSESVWRGWQRVKP